MLKIKDDVDLKELEKFGFINTKDDTWYKSEPNDAYDYFKTNIVINPVGKFKKNEIIFEIYDLDNSEDKSDIDIAARFDTLYDLIQARISRKGVVMEIRERCISKKEYLKRDDSNVGYALHVQNNIKKDDYAKLNTGEIVKVTGIRENQVNKKAIYFGIYDDDWCDSAAVENFSENIIDLIEVGDIVFIQDVLNNDFVYIYDEEMLKAVKEDVEEGLEITEILTHEQFEKICYKLKGE